MPVLSSEFLNLLSSTQACPPGTFGADCKQKCHCAVKSSCDRAMGTCSAAGCEEGWTGENCNGKID